MYPISVLCVFTGQSYSQMFVKEYLVIKKKNFGRLPKRDANIEVWIFINKRTFEKVCLF